MDVSINITTCSTVIEIFALNISALIVVLKAQIRKNKYITKVFLNSQ